MTAAEASAVAESLRALDAEWFTTVLRDGGHTEAAVTAVAVEPMAFTGAVADMARVRLSYAGDGTTGPATAIAKIRGADEMRLGMDAAMGLYEREGRFYAELAEHVPVGTPRCYHVGDGTVTPLLLEDLGELRVGDQMEGLTVTDAERMMDVLGDFHAGYWESPELEADWLAAPAEGAFAAMIVQIVGSGFGALQERYAGRVSDAALAGVGELAPRWGDVLARGAEGPQTLVHNDCRLDNMFFRADGEPVLVDWQIPARTRGTQDVGNLLAGSMDSEDLRANWEALLRRYHERLRAGGVSDYGWDECREHYRQNILYPLGAGIALLGTLDIGDDRGLGDVIVLRALEHCDDLDSFSSV